MSLASRSNTFGWWLKNHSNSVTKEFEQQLGRFNEETYKMLAAGEDVEKARAKIEAMVGPSGFMLFRTSDHGALFRISRPKEESDPVSGRQSAVRDPDDGAGHPRQPVCALAGVNLRRRKRKNLCRVRQAVVALWSVRQREGYGALPPCSIESSSSWWPRRLNEIRGSRQFGSPIVDLHAFFMIYSRSAPAGQDTDVRLKPDLRMRSHERTRMVESTERGGDPADLRGLR